MKGQGHWNVIKNRNVKDTGMSWKPECDRLTLPTWSLGCDFSPPETEMSGI